MSATQNIRRTLSGAADVPTINRPMKAVNYEPALARFPYLCTPKIDGIRFIVGDDCVLSCSMKPIPNKLIQALQLYPGMEGEFFCGSFNATTRVVMAHDAPISQLDVLVFDYIEPTCPIKEYNRRVGVMRAVTTKSHKNTWASVKSCTPLMPKLIRNQAELDVYVAACLTVGHEGVMLRNPLGLYKQGRSTQNDQYLMRIKPYEDAEGTVVGVEPYERNTNESFCDERGLARKSHAKDGKVQLDLLGSLVLRMADGIIVKCGSGFTDEDRVTLWANQPIGQVVKFKYQKHGTVRKPRCPIFLGFRHEVDREG